jgi:threonine synthase
MRYTGLINHYKNRLPVDENTRFISLGEGNTPLIRLENIPALVGKKVDIYVKYEGLNPTGSVKDRGMTMAVTKAVEAGSKAIICASTGNTSASAAAYAARAGITPNSSIISNAAVFCPCKRKGLIEFTIDTGA